MSDRLAELRRQRALVQEHLAWLDRELAALENQPLPAPTTPASPDVSHAPTAARGPAAAVTPHIVATPVATPTVTPPADSILEQYRVPSTVVRENVRKGCLLYFAAAFALLIVIVGILYVALSR